MFNHTILNVQKQYPQDNQWLYNTWPPTSMAGQSALLRMIVVGTSESANSSSRSTTYAIRRGMNSSLRIISLGLNNVRNMFLPILVLNCIRKYFLTSFSVKKLGEFSYTKGLTQNLNEVPSITLTTHQHMQIHLTSMSKLLSFFLNYFLINAPCKCSCHLHLLHFIRNNVCPQSSLARPASTYMWSFT